MPLMKQKIRTLQDYLEQESCIDAMDGYPHEYQGWTSLLDPSIMGLQNQIITLTKKLKDLQPVRLAKPKVWCTHYIVEGHVTTECLRLRGINHPWGVTRSSGTPPTAGVAVVGAQGVFSRQNN